MPDLKPDEFERIATLFVPEAVSAMAISPDGRYVAIAAGDKLHIHGTPQNVSGSVGAADFPRLITLYMPDKVQSVVFWPGGHLLAVAIADKLHIYRIPK